MSIAVGWKKATSKRSVAGCRLHQANGFRREGRVLAITPGKQLVWEYVVPVERDGPLAQGDTIPANRGSGNLLNEYFLAYRFAADHPALAGKTPRGVIERPARSATVRQQSTVREPATFRPANLTVQQQKSYDAIMEQFRAKRQAVFGQVGGDRQQIGRTMMALAQEQNKEVRELLNDAQYAQYTKWTEQQRSQQRSGLRGAQQRGSR